MSGINSIDILLAISSYLRRGDRTRCCLVCKTWYNAFMPLIWKSIDYTTVQPNSQTLIRHSHFVKDLTLEGYISPELSKIRFPNLTSIQHSIAAKQGVEILLLHAPTLVHLDLRMINHEASSLIWSAIHKLSNLKSIYLVNVDVPQDCILLFVDFYKRLESLTMRNVSFVSHLAALQSSFYIPVLTNAAPSATMTSLTLSALNGISPIEQIEWIAGFQNITQLTWECSHGDHHTSIFLRYLREGRWPYLTSLSLNGSQIPDKYLASILKPLSRLKEFHANWTGFGVRAFHVLERSFESSLESLDITYCAGVDDRGLMGRMAQKIFESCNKLRTFKCGMVSAYEFVEGGPWSGCEQSLESLRIYFDFTPRRLTGSGSDVEGSLDAFELPIIDIQRFIFKRLSTLTRLQYINVGYDQKTISGLDFRLSHGMGQLATLKRLYILRLHNLVQQMGEDEVKWILEHWKMLAALQIQMHDNSELDVKLRRQLVAGGIYIYR